MLRLRTALCVFLTAAAIAGCTYYQVAPAPAGSSVFDRAWNAALGAAADVGVYVSSADRSSGVIRGTAGADAVTINVFTQADGSVRVEFNVRGAAGNDPALANSLSRAYDRRMGR
jgi:hypothetical protein